MKKFFAYYDKVLLIFFLFFVFLGYSVIAVSSYYQYQTFAWDLGFFDQLIWKISRFIYPISSLNEVNILANHFSPILFFLAPLYWIYSSPVMLLIAQAFIMVSAAYPLYLLAIKKTQSFIFSLAVVFSYLFFLGTQWSILNEFHEATFAPLFIVLIFYALETNFNKALFIIGSVGLLITKEIFSLLLASIGLTIMLYYKQKKLGAFIFFFSLFFSFFLLPFLCLKFRKKVFINMSIYLPKQNHPQNFFLKAFTILCLL